MSRELTILATRDQFVDTVADAAERVIHEAVCARGIAHVALTGGTIGIAVLAGMGLDDSVDWGKVHFWWGDERFVDSDSDDRNANQARTAFLSRLGVPQKHVHEMPAADSGLTLDEAAAVYARDLAAFAKHGDQQPVFDLTFLGIGPDSHVASLFPNHEDARQSGIVVSVRNSPKPPPERLSLTFQAINASERVWVVAYGLDKAEALERMFSSHDDLAVPSSCVHGCVETRVWADADAASALLT